MRRVALAIAMLLLAGPALADPPARVGRLSFSEGVVWHKPGDGSWLPAPLNYPVTSGTALRTGADARAEIQIGPVEVHLDRATQLVVPQLDDARTVLHLDHGTLALRLRVPADDVVVETQLGDIRLRAAGRYRLDLHNDRPARLGVTAFDGHATYAGPAGIVDVHSGQAVQIGGEPLRIALGDAGESPFDQWVAQRTRTVSPVAGPHLSPEITGWQDLDAHGRWHDDPAYGAVWYPHDLPPDWTPYSRGHWAYVSPWGWTWIDAAPWGFAPFHYGRWIKFDRRWAWCPGPVRARPVYAPALVVFVGRGPHDRADERHGHKRGWRALHWHEAYRPPYRASAGYLQRINAGLERGGHAAAVADRVPERRRSDRATASPRPADGASPAAAPLRKPPHATGGGVAGRDSVAPPPSVGTKGADLRGRKDRRGGVQPPVKTTPAPRSMIVRDDPGAGAGGQGRVESRNMRPPPRAAGSRARQAGDGPAPAVPAARHAPDAAPRAAAPEPAPVPRPAAPPQQMKPVALPSTAKPPGAAVRRAAPARPQPGWSRPPPASQLGQPQRRPAKLPDVRPRPVATPSAAPVRQREREAARPAERRKGGGQHR